MLKYIVRLSILARLAFDLSAKFAHVGSHIIIFSETPRQIRLNFYMKPPYGKFAKLYTNCLVT